MSTAPNNADDQDSDYSGSMPWIIGIVFLVLVGTIGYFHFFDKTKK